MPVPVLVGAGIAAAGVGLYQQNTAQRRAQQAAQQQSEAARAEQQRIEGKFALSPEELAGQDQYFKDLQRRSGLSGEQLLGETGPITSQLLKDIAARQGLSGRDLFLREGGLAAQQLTDRVEAPGAQDTFAPELELVRQMVNAEANKRGVFGGLPEGGIRFEQLGRAGVDLAIKSARESLAQKQALASNFINLAASGRSEAGKVGESGVNIATDARAELDRFLGRREGTAAQTATSAFATGQGGVNAGENARQEVFGAQAAQGAGLARTGIGALSDFALSQIPTPATTTTTTSPVQQRTPELLPGENLSLRSGAVGNQYLDDEYQRIRRMGRG